MRVCHTKKEQEKNELNKYDLSKLKGWTRKKDVVGLEIYWRTVPMCKGLEINEELLLKITEM